MAETISEINDDLKKIQSALTRWQIAREQIPEIGSTKTTSFARSEFFAPEQEEATFIALTRRVWEKVLDYNQFTVDSEQDPTYCHRSGEFNLFAKKQPPNLSEPAAFLVVNVGDKTRNITLRLSILLKHSYGMMIVFSNGLYSMNMLPFQSMTDEEYRIFSYYLEQYLQTKS